MTTGISTSEKRFAQDNPCDRTTREAMLSCLAAVVNSISREINLQTETKEDMVHLTALEINVMNCIDEHPGIAPCEVAMAVGLQRSNLSAILRGLTSKGMIESVPDKDDGRMVHLYPTEVATRNMNRHRSIWASILDALPSNDALLKPALEYLSQVNSGLLELRRSRS